MTVRDQLLVACENGDHAAIHRLGWGDVGEVLATGWAPRQTCSMNELKPWAKMLGNEDPVALLSAIDECAGVWRPTPGQIRGHLNAKRDDSSVDVGRGRDRAGSEEALRAVADAIRSGEQPCSCGYHSPQWRCAAVAKKRKGIPLCAADYVLRCPSCDGIEPGQVYAVEDAA